MKIRLVFFILFLAGLFHGNKPFAQTPSAYKLPDNYRFDYEVTQEFAGKKNAADSSVVHFYYSKSGDYAAARLSGKARMKGNLFVVLTRDGNAVIFDEHDKKITIISVRKLVSDLAGLAKYIRMDSLMAGMREKRDGRDFQSVKTGKTKQLGNYASEEYSFSDNKGHKGTAWCARVDFYTQGDYILGALGANFLQMMNNRMAGNPFFQALIQSKTLVTTIAIADSTGGKKMVIQTISVDQVLTTISTESYSVNNYSNMTLPEIIQAEMKKGNNWQ